MKKSVKHLHYNKKKDIISQLKGGEKGQSLAAKYGVDKATISRIRKDAGKILGASEDQQDLKRVKQQKYPQIDEMMLEWFEEARDRNYVINDEIIKQTALVFGSDLGLTDFKASSSWVIAFKRKHGIKYPPLYGEASSVSEVVVEDYKTQFNGIIEGYDPKDIFNFDETSLFFKLLPSHSLCMDAKASGVKKLKDRFSVGLCASSLGEKLEPLIIGHSASPRCFKGLDLTKIGISYKSSKKAWMTSTLFKEYLDELNSKMKAQGRKILLLVDNAPSHILGEELSNVQVSFLPKNTTSVLQPLDMGIIRAFKAYYRSVFLKHFIINKRKVEEAVKDVNLALAINWAAEAWQKVKPVSIQNCFHKTGLFGGEAQPQSDDSAKELQVILKEVRCDISAEEYLESDNINITYTENEKDLPHDIYRLFVTIPTSYDEEDHTSMTKKGVTASRLHSHIEELRWGFTNVKDPNLKRKYQELITELSGSMGCLYKQAKLSFTKQPSDDN